MYNDLSINHDIVEISQGSIIETVIQQAEHAYRGEKNKVSNVLLTSPTGAGKSLLFQLAAIYLAEKYGLLTIIDDEFKVSFMPIETSSNGEMVECASEVEAAQILCSLRERSQNIENEEFIQEKFSEFCESKRDFYLKAFSGKESKIFKVLNRLLGGYLRKAKIRNRYDKHALVVIQNFVECEAHREVVIGGLQHVTRSFE